MRDTEASGFILTLQQLTPMLVPAVVIHQLSVDYILHGAAVLPWYYIYNSFNFQDKIAYSGSYSVSYNEVDFKKYINPRSHVPWLIIRKCAHVHIFHN